MPPCCSIMLRLVVIQVPSWSQSGSKNIMSTDFTDTKGHRQHNGHVSHPNVNDIWPSLASLPNVKCVVAVFMA